MQLKDKIFIRWALAIPVFNILMDIIMNFFPAIKTPVGIFRLLFMAGIIVYFLNYYHFKKTRLNRTLIFFMLYLTVVSILSSSPVDSFIDGPIKISLSLFMIPIGMQLGLIKQNSLTKPMIWVIGFLLLNYILSQVYKLGVSIYEKDSFYTGGATASAPVTIALGLLVIFNAFNKKVLPYKNIIILSIVSMSVFAILISLKRGAIFSLLAALIIYFIFSEKKVKTLIRVIFTGLFLSIFIISYSDVLEERIDARTTERNELQNEGRFKETLYIIDEFKNYNLIKVFFGYEAFNSGVVMKKYFGRERQLHVDYNILLHGTGLFGLLLYFYIIYLILRKTNRTKRKAINSLQSKYFRTVISENFALGVSTIILSLVMSFSGGLQFVSYRVMLFLIIGYTIGEMQALIQNEQKTSTS